MKRSTIRKATPQDLLLLLFLSIIWGSAFLAIKVVVPETGPLWLPTIRVLIAFVVLLPLSIGKGLIWPKDRNEWKLILLIMLLNVVAPFFLISWAEQQINAGTTSLLMGIGPFLALIGSHFTTHDDKLSKYKIIGALLGFTGISLLVGREAILGLGANLLGQGAAMLGTSCYVTSGLIVRKLARFPSDRLSTLVLGLASITLIILTLSIDGLPAHQFSQQTWILLLYLGLFPTALGYILRYYLINKIGMSVYATGINLIPVFGVLLSALLLGEVLSANLFLSLIFIVTGLFIIRKG
ncbi:MAG: DMT family transporter [Proteobacteria bacterium]|nr:DMT family transporter [Pseudomonadota bacterium]